MKRSWTLGRTSGIDVFVHATFLLLIGWIVITHWLSGHNVAARVAGVVFMLTLPLQDLSITSASMLERLMPSVPEKGAWHLFFDRGPCGLDRGPRGA